MQAVKIGPDMSTATGIQRRIEQRIQELKEQLPPFDETEGERPEAWVINELRSLHKEIENDIDAMIEDMEREHQERARQKEIRMHEAGITEDDIKTRRF